MKPLDLIPRRRHRPARPLFLLGLAASLLTAALFFWKWSPLPSEEPLAVEADRSPPLLRPSGGRDAFGDPLPPGAVGRLGSTRLRHGGPVRAVVFLRDGKVLASGSEDGTLSHWDVATGEELYRTEQLGGVKALALSPDGSRLAASGARATLYLMEAETGAPLARFLPGMKGGFSDGDVRQLAFSPDASSMALLHRDGSLVFWDPSGTKVWASSGLQFAVFAGFDAQGELVLGARDGAVEIRNGTGTTTRSRWTSELGSELYALSHDGRILAAPPAGHLTLFELESGRELQRLGSASGLSAMTFSPDDRWLLAGMSHGRVQIWNVETGKRLIEIQRGRAPVLSVDFSPDGETLAWGGMDGRVRLWNLESGELFRDLDSHAGSINAIAFEDRKVASGSSDGTIVEWDLTTGDAELLGFRDEIHFVSYLSDHRLLAVDSRGYHLWERPSGLVTSEVQFGDRRQYFALSGDKLVAGRRGLTEIWNLATGEGTSFILDDDEMAVAISPDGETVATARGGKRLVLRELDGQIVYQGQQPYGWYFSSVCFLPGGEHLVTDVAVWKLPPRGFSTGGSDLESYSSYRRGGLCAVSPDGRLLATRGDDERSIELHDIDLRGQEKISRRLQIGVHRGKVTSLAFSADGKLLASGGAEGTSLLWSVSDLLPPGAPAERASSGGGVATSAETEASERSTSLIRIEFEGPMVEGDGVITTYVANLTEDEGELRFIPGVEKQAALWRGALEFPEAASLELDGGYTIQFWFRLEPEADGTLADFRTVLSSDVLTFDVRGGRPYFFLHFDNGGHQQSTPFENREVIEPGRWYHVAVTRDPRVKTSSIYIDGVLRDAKETAGRRPALRLGTIRLGGWPNFHGAFDELTIDDAPRSYAQIAEAAGLDTPVVETPSLDSDNLAPPAPSWPPAEEPILNEDVTQLVQAEEHQGFIAYDFTAELVNTKVLDLAVAEDLVWIATDRGLLRHDPSDGSFYLYGSNTGIPGAYVSEVVAMGGRIAVDLGSFGLPNSVLGLGTFLFDPREKTWELFHRGGGSELLWDGERLWRGAEAIDPVTKEIERLPEGEGGLLHHSVNSLERFGDVVFFAMSGDYIQETKGFAGGGVSRLQLSTGEWQSYQRKDGLAWDYSAALSVEAEEVWVVHWEEEIGISRLDRHRNRWVGLSKSRNGVVLGGTGVESDGKTVWIGQQGGLVVLDKSSLKAELYREPDGLPGYIVSGMALGRRFLWAGAYSYGDERVRSSGLARFPRR